MPDAWASLSPVETGWLLAAAFLAGLVRGFTGFGSGLVFMPVAAGILPPFGAILAMTMMDLLGPVPIVRRAWDAVDRRDLLRMVLGCVIALPLGMWVLTRVAPEIFQVSVSLVALAMLAVVALGLRYRGTVGRKAVTGIGGAAGFLGGVAGLPGPPVILFYMSRPLPVKNIRATILLFLLVYDLLLMLFMVGFGRWDTGIAVMGLVFAVPNVIGNWLGAWLFRSDYERFYRGTAYAVIAVSALSGLPVWG